MSSPNNPSEDDAEKFSTESNPSKILSPDSPLATSSAVCSASQSDEDISQVDDDDGYPPVDGGIQAWLFVLCGFVLEMVVYGFCYSYGILQDYYMTHAPFDQSNSIAIALVGPIAISLQYLPNLPISLGYVRYPDYMRPSMWLGLALYFVSLLCSSFATQVWQLILLQGFILGLGGTIMYVPVLKLISEWFVKRRGLATGIIFAGGGIGGFIFPYAYTSLIDRVGLPWAIRVWAIVTSVISALAIIGIHPRKPMLKFESSSNQPDLIPPQLVFLKSKLFWSSSMTIFFHGLGYFATSLYIASFTRELTSLLTATVILSLFSLSGVAGQLALGWLSDRIHCTWVMLISTSGTTIGSYLLWGFAGGPLELYFFTIIVGFLSGGFSSTWPNIGFEIADHKAEVVGLAITSGATFKGVAAICGPLIANLLLKAGNGKGMGAGFGHLGYGPVQLFVGSCSLAATMFSIVNILITPKPDPEERKLEQAVVVTELGVVELPTNASSFSLSGVPNLNKKVHIPAFQMDSLVNIISGQGRSEVRLDMFPSARSYLDVERASNIEDINHDSILRKDKDQD